MPNRRIAAMTNVVMTGRRMNGSAIFIADFLAALRRGFDLNFHTGNQPKLAVSDDSLAWFHAFRDHGFRAQGPRRFHRTRLSSSFRVDHEHEIPALSSLHRLGRNDGSVFIFGQTKGHSRKLSRPEPGGCISKRSFG